MAEHNDLGDEAEELAVNYLTQHGYEILYRNWTHSHYEIDIVAVKNELLRIIEVKALKTARVRYPEESVTKKKFKSVLRAADQFLYQNPQFRNVQFEILSIIINPGKEPEYFLIEDVFL